MQPIIPNNETKDKVKRKYIEDMVQKSINERIEARELARKAKLEIVNM